MEQSAGWTGDESFHELFFGREGVDFVIVGEDKKFAFSIFDEGGGAEFFVLLGAGEDLGVGRLFSIFVSEAPEAAESPVAIEILALKGGDGFAAIVKSAGDGDAAEAVVFMDGVDEFYCLRGLVIAGIGGVGAFFKRPTIITAFLDNVDFFPSALADVGGPEFLSGRVEGEAPGVAKAEGEDFGMVTWLVEEGIVVREAVGSISGTGVDVDTKNFSVVDESVLREPLEVVGFAAVSDGNVEVAVGSEEDVT